MTLKVREATAEDIPAMADVIFAAFNTDPLHVAMFPRDNQASYMDFYHQKLQGQLDDPTIHTVVVEDSTGDRSEGGEIVAYARWQMPPVLNRTIDAPSRVNGVQPAPVPFPTGANAALVDYYVAEVDNFRAQHVNNDHDIILHMLVTHPQHQRRGAAKTLLQYGFDAAEKIALDAGESVRRPIFLEATPEAAALYSRLGWKGICDIRCELAHFGVEHGEPHVTICMRRA